MQILRMSKAQALGKAVFSLTVGLLLLFLGISVGSPSGGLYCGGMFFFSAAFFGLVFWLKVKRNQQPRTHTWSLPQEPAVTTSHPDTSSDLFVPDSLD